MRHRIVSLSTFQTAKVLALWYFLMGIVYVPLLIVADLSSPRHERVGIFWVFAPILFAIVGYLFGALGCLLYNLAASKTGGIELMLESQPEAPGTAFGQNPG